jgi:hypothetical protein
VYESEIFVEFKHGNHYITYTFIEPDSFWATPTTGTSFPTTGPSLTGLVAWPNAQNDLTGVDQVFGSTGDGATIFKYDDPNQCAGCTITIAEVAQTPEPASILMLGSSLAGLAGFLRRKMTRV